MKKLDKFIVKSFAGPYFLSFFIAEFVLIMQFLWKYIDDILGKGYGMLEILELLFYNAVTIIPQALPISILLASVMVFGDISEKYELSSFKSAGVSLVRVMRPAIVIALLTSIFSLFASNYLKPAANLQYQKLFDLIRRQKATLAIEAGIFNSDFTDLVVRVGKKDENGIDMQNVLIYETNVQDKSLMNMIKSDSAKMSASSDGKYFFMDLMKGEQVQELERNTDPSGKTPLPMVRMSFKTLSKVIDMNGFYLSESDITVNKERAEMLNSFQLKTFIDSLTTIIDTNRMKIKNDYSKILTLKSLELEQYEKLRSIEKPKSNPIVIDTVKKIKDTIPKVIVKNDGSINTENAFKKTKESVKKRILHKNREKVKFAKKDTSNVYGPLYQQPILYDENYIARDTVKNIRNAKTFLALYDSISIKNLTRKAMPFVNINLDNANNGGYNLNTYNVEREKYRLMYNTHFSNALICIIFLFIGAPLGSIIRKGGYGYPLLIAILFYILYMINAIVGQKLVKSDILNGWFGAWLPCLVLLPFSIVFTYQALKDKSFTWLADLESKVLNLIKSVKEKRKAKLSVES